MITRLGLYGGAAQLYGTFVGKTTEVASSHPVVKLTRIGTYGGPRSLYGSFALKTPEVDVGGSHPVPRLTRIGMYGGARELYGSFLNKTLAVEEPVKRAGSMLASQLVRRQINRGRR